MNLQEALEQHKPFLNNKYTKWYLSIVSKECDDNYVERHHILPRCLFPQYAKSEWNIVKLSARKHYIVHVLLYRMFEKNTKQYGKMLTASLRMKTHSTNNRYVNSRLYEITKIKFSNYLRETLRWSEEHKTRISKKLKGIVRGPMSEETKLKMIATKKSKNLEKSTFMVKDGIQKRIFLTDVEEYKKQGWIRGTKMIKTEEYRQKLSNATKKQWQKMKDNGHFGNLKTLTGTQS
jgi:hypothetical protein